MFQRIGCLLAVQMIAMGGAFAATTQSSSGPRDLTVQQKPDEKTVEQESMDVLEQDFQKAEMKEEKIPVLVKTAPVKQETSNPFARMIIALGVICALGAGTLVYVKKFKKLNITKGPSPKIQVLNQHYLGPKKSLAIVKIAGESILIGITDHNITPIRVLSLLDDELPPQNATDFNSAMQNLDFFEEAQDDFSFSSPRRS